MLLDLKELEELAAFGNDIPSRITTAEKMLYLGLRALHTEYRLGRISREKAHDEKMVLIKDYTNICNDLKRQSENIKKQVECIKKSEMLRISICKSTNTDFILEKSIECIGLMIDDSGVFYKTVMRNIDRK